MIFKKSNIVHSDKDTLADSYLKTIKEQHEKVKAKTREIQKCIQEGLACPLTEGEIKNGEDEVLQ